MKPKLLTRSLFMAILSCFTAKAFIYIDSSPAWLDWDFYGGDNYIKDPMTQFHVKEFILGLTDAGAIYTINILGDGVTRKVYPTAGWCVSNTKTLTLAANERVSKIEAWWHTLDWVWYRVKFKLNTGVILEHNPPHNQFYDSLYTFTIPVGKEFTGFYLSGYFSGCGVSNLRAIVRPACSVVFDLSQIHGLNQKVFIDTQKTIQFDVYSSSDCSSPIQYQVSVNPSTPTPNLIQLPTPTEKSILFGQSLSFNDVKIYTLTFEALPLGTFTWLSPTTATYTYIDPCTSTSIDPLTMSPMTTSVLKQTTPGGTNYQETQTVTPTNSQSVTQNDPSFCGSYQFSISSIIDAGSTATQILTSPELVIDSSGTIKLYSTSSNSVGSHTASVTVQLTNYPTKSRTFSLPITIQPCELTSFTMSALSPITYVIGDNPGMAWSITGSAVTTQVPACGYSLTLTSSSTSTILTDTPGSTIGFQIFSRDVSNAGTFTVDVTATLNSYTYSTINLSCQSTFELTVDDSCYITQINTYPPKVVDLVTFAGYRVQSLQKYVFNDTISEAKTYSTDSKDFCGDKVLHFKLNGTTTSFLFGTNTDYIYLSPPANTQEFGVAQATVQAVMKNYPDIVSSQVGFTATILGSTVPSIDDKTYISKTSPLQIIYEPFKVLPLFYDVGPSSVEAYIYAGYSLPDKIHLSCDCLSSIVDLDWITLDSTANTLTIYTSKNDYVGSYRIVLIQKFENFFPDVIPFTYFTLEIQPAPVFSQSKPPFFEHDLTTVKVTQCQQNVRNDFWSFELPEVIDPSNSVVSLKADFDTKFFKYDESIRKIIQIQILEHSVNKTLKFRLENEFKVSATYQMKVIFLCTTFGAENFDPVSQTKFEVSKVKVPFPVKIATVSRRGAVEIQFLLSVRVPNYTRPASQLGTDGQRHLEVSKPTLPLEHFVNDGVLKVQLLSQYSLTNLAWWCTDYTSHYLKLQLNFTDLMEVSQRYKDQLVVTFQQTDLFVLYARDEYLFQNDSAKTITHYIPTQLPSESAAGLLQLITESVQKVGTSVIVITLVVQIVAKKIITYVWLYYCALQIVILFVQRSNMVPPPSVELVIEQISGIINLSSLDKQKIATILGLDIITQSEFYQALDGVALSAIAVLTLLVVVGIAFFISKKSPKTHALMIKIKNTIFWNFLIRYFQAAFIGFNFAALKTVQKHGDGLKDIGSSVIILVIQYSIVALVSYILIRKNLRELNNVRTKEKIGNLYFNLDTNERRKVLFGLFFFLQRCILILVLALSSYFSIQWQLCLTVIILNTVYLLSEQPYKDQSTSTLDLINCVFLVLTTILITTFSAWNADPHHRFMYGMVFDALAGLHFLVNIVFVINQLAGQLILKLKQIKYRYSNRKKYSAKTRFDRIKMASIPVDTFTIDQKSANKQEPNSLNDQTSSQSELQIKPGTRYSQFIKLSIEKQLRARQSQRNQVQEQLEQISELSEHLENNSENELSFRLQRNTKQSNIKAKRWRPPTPLPRRGTTDQQEEYERKSPDTKEYNYSLNMPKLDDSPWKQYLSRQYQNFDKKLPTDHINPTLSINTNQDQIARDNHAVNTYDARSNSRCDQMMSADLVDQRFEFVDNRQKTDKLVVQNFRPAVSQNIENQMHDQEVEHNFKAKQKWAASRYDLVDKNLISLKTKKQPSFNFLLWKIAPNKFDLKVPANRVSMDFMGQERQFLQKTSDDYFANQPPGVRCYKREEKTFKWMEDVWPFYRQSMEHNYSGPSISDDEHREYVKVHLYKEWIKEYPKMPRLPLMVSVDLYNKVCREIKPHVVEYATKKQQRNE